CINGFLRACGKGQRYSAAAGVEQLEVRVRVLPLQPHCFAFGGFEVQMLNATDAARACGVDVQPMDIWSRDRDFDVLHVWGLDVAHTPAVYWARQSGKHVVMTALLPYLTVKRRLRYL